MSGVVGVVAVVSLCFLYPAGTGTRGLPLASTGMLIVLPAAFTYSSYLGVTKSLNEGNPVGAVGTACGCGG